MISHSHLDHVAGLAHVSPDLGGISRQKLVYGTESTIEAIKTSIFNNLVRHWPLHHSDGLNSTSWLLASSHSG